MALKRPNWQKDYDLQNCEVCGFVRLVGLKPDRYNKMKYQLNVLIDKEIAKSILEETTIKLDELQQDYGKTKNPVNGKESFVVNVKDFAKISDIVKATRDKGTGDLVVDEYAPDGKLVLNLATDSNNGEYQIIMADAQGEIITEQKNVYAGSLVNVRFRLSAYLSGKDIGITLRMQAIQIIKNASPSSKNDLTKNPFKPVENASDFEDEYVESADDDEEEI